MGQPTVMTEEKLAQLKMAFMIGASDREACAYADIAPSTLYEYQIANPEYAEQKAQWKETPILKARQELVKGLEGNPDLSLRYLERKRKAEFSLRTETTGKEGAPIEHKVETTISLDERLNKALEELKDIKTSDHE